MKLTAIILLAAGLAAAQNVPVFPGRAATNGDLFVATNNFATTLLTGITSATATSATVASATGLTIPAMVTIDTEIFAVCQVTGNTLTFGKSSCPNADGRGYDGSVAVNHVAGRPVEARVVAGLHNQPSAEVIALENATPVMVSDLGPYATLSAANAAAIAAGRTLAISKRWMGAPTQTLGSVTFVKGGMIQPAAGQVITISGAVSAPDEKIFDTSLGGPGSIKFTGATSTIHVQWFGGVGDCVAINDAAEAAAVASIATISSGTLGGYVYHPHGCYRISTDIIGAQGVVLTGDNQNSAIIQAAPGFNGQYLYSIGNGSMLMTNTGFQNLQFDCGTATACSGISMNRVQEGTICRDSAISGFTGIGLHVFGAGAQNFQCMELHIHYRAGSTTAQPIVWGTSAGGTILQRITVVNPVNGASMVPYCMLVGGQNVTIQTFHMEGCARGVDVSNGASAITINGVTGDPTTTDAIYIENGAEAISVNNCNAAGSATCVFDASNNNLRIGVELGHYFVLNGRYTTDDGPRGAINSSWDGTNQTAFAVPAPTQTGPIFGVLNTALSAFQWAIDHDGTMISSGWKPQVVSTNSAYIVRAIDQIVLGNASGGSFAITLPAAGSTDRSLYTIMKSDNGTNAITLNSAGGAINGAPSYVLSGGALHAVTVAATGGAWYILSFY